jgi:ubiquinone/menaquinone biosynthesis C-methylase UbiE
MRTRLSKNNPFANSIRLGQAFAWEIFREQTISGKDIVALDYGAFDAKMLDQFVKDKIVTSAISVDLNKDIVELSKNSLQPNHKLFCVVKGMPLPFDDAYFDIVTVIGVVEHVYDQLALLAELRRVLKHDGILIVAVPGKHLFSFLDFGNWKFRFPNIHKLYITIRFGKKYYQKYYVECANGLVGDVELEKKWHQHFSHFELSQLLNESGFTVCRKDGFGFFFRLLHNIAYFLPFFKRIFYKLIMIDAKYFSKAELFVEARKL